MQKVFDNLINGNLEDAKRGAERFGTIRLINHAVHEMEWSAMKSLRAVQFLKKGGSFQAYCDAK